MVTNHTFAQVNADDNALRFDEPHNFSGYFPAPAAQVEYSVAWARAKQLQNRRRSLMRVHIRRNFVINRCRQFCGVSMVDVSSLISHVDSSADRQSCAVSI